MKYELLKRTAIALFVGGVISTYASADGKLDDALATIKTAIETNKAGLESKADKALVDELDEDVGNLEDKVSGIVATAANKEDLGKLNDAVETLRDDVNNNTDTLSQNSEDIAANKEAIEANKTAIATNKAGLESKADKALVDELDEDVGNLEDKVSGIVATAANKEDLGKLNDAVETLRDDVNNNTDILSQNSTDIAANKEAIEANKAAIETNKAALESKADKTALETKADQDYVEGLEKDVKINTSDIKELSEGIRDNILPALEANRTDIDANKAAIGDLATVIDEAVKNVEAGIETNAANFASNVDKIATNESKVAENRKDINKNASRIEDTRNKQVLQNARLDNHNSRIDANKAALETKADKTALEAKADKADVDANKEEIAKKANQTDVNKNKTEIAKKADKAELEKKADKDNVYSKSQTDEKFALKADNSVVRDQATDISNLRTDVNAHKVDIDKLRTDVNVHTKRLDHLDNRVNKLDKDLKRGLAAQAALTGLFQPYTVGKANFTAAVGGYKSQTAVAIGTGYRYNQNIATKAGVAFTQGGGVTYNAGVNFEW